MTELLSDDVTTAEAADLERRIAEGDETFTVKDLDAVDAAEKQGRLTRLKAKAKANRAERDAESARLARIEEAQQRIRSQFGGAALIVAFEAAVVALTALVEAAAEHNTVLHDVMIDLHGLRPLPNDLQVDTAAGHLRLSSADLTLAPVDTAQMAAEAAWRALVAAGDRSAGTVEQSAGIIRDHHAAEYFGLPRRADGSPAPSGLSDRLRRTASVIAELT